MLCQGERSLPLPHGPVMAESKEKVRGYLVISAREASGKNKEEKVVWDPSFVEGFVKGTHFSAVPLCAGGQASLVAHNARCTA